MNNLIVEPNIVTIQKSRFAVKKRVQNPKKDMYSTSTL